MPTPSTSELPKPLSWDEFEDIVWDIYKRKWNDPDAQRYGRSGQAQQGVDVYGRPSELGEAYVGVQCKRYENLKLATVEAEIKKAETFEPPLAGFIIATTAGRDAQLQRAVRLITQEREATTEPAKRFPVTVVFWEDLCSELAKPENADLLVKHYGEWLGRFRRILEDGDFDYRPIKLHAPLRKVFDPLIEDRMKLFGGRDKALTEIAAFIQESKGGYLVVTAPPGFGKTALMASMVKATPDLFAYHFFTPLYGDESLSEVFFLRNVVEQMAQWHGHTGELPAQPSELRALYQRFIDEPLNKTQVLILDGLDEVTLLGRPDQVTRWNLAPYLSRHLPDNLHIVVTIRDVGQDWRRQYGFPADQTTHLPLGGLAEDEVAQVLRAAGGPAVAFADNRALLGEVVRVAGYEADESLGADPFYVRLLAEDAAAGKLAPDEVGKRPSGLNNYLKDWWQQVKDVAGDQPARDLFGTLTVALGPISRADLEAINASLVDEWAQDRFDEVLAGVQRFVMGDKRHGYALAHPRLRDYMRTQIRIAPYLDKLLAYCARWQEHGSRYALTHYAAHLADAGREDPKRVEELYNLISDDWRRAKLAVFHSSQPFAEDVLQAIKAAEAETPVRWEQLIPDCLIYATLGSIASNVPPEVLGVLVQTAEPEVLREVLDTALGNAALVQDRRDQADAYRSIGEALWRRGVSGKAREVLGLALASTRGIDGEAARADALRALAQVLALAGEEELLAEVVASAQKLKDEDRKAWTLTWMVGVLDQAWVREAAASAAHEALAAAKETNGGEAKARALGGAAHLLAQLGEPEAAAQAAHLAVEVLAETEDLRRTGWHSQRYAVDTLNELARALALIEDMVAAHARCAEALAAAEMIDGLDDRAAALSAVAQCMEAIGQAANAKDVARRALAAAVEVRAPWFKGPALARAADALAAANDRDGLHEALDEVKALEVRFQLAAFGALAQGMARIGDRDGLADVLRAACDAWGWTSAVHDVVPVFLASCDSTEAAWAAEKLVAYLKRGAHREVRAGLLTLLARTLIKAGKRERAHEAATAALVAAGGISRDISEADAFSAVSLALSGAGKRAEGAEAARRAYGIAKAVSGFTPEEPLARAAEALARAGDREGAIEAARAAFNELEEGKDIHGVLSRISGAMAHVGEFERALEFSRGDPEPGEALCEIARAVIRAGNEDAHGEVIDQALGAAEYVQLDREDGLSQLARALVLVGEREKAAEKVGEQVVWLDKDGTRYPQQTQAYRLSEVAKALVVVGDLEGARGIAKRALAAAEADEHGYRSFALNRVAQAYLALGEKETARAIARRAMEDAATVAPHAHSQAWAAAERAARTLARLGDGEGIGLMLEAVPTLPEAGPEPASLEALIESLGLVGYTSGLARARSVIDQTGDPADRVGLLGLLANGLLLAGAQAEAEEALRVAVLAARTLGRAAVLEVVGRGAAMLARLDGGQTLAGVYDRVMEVESWWVGDSR